MPEQIAAELRQTIDGLNVLVKELRDRAQEAETKTDALIEAKTTGLATAITEIRAKQDQLELKLKAPPTTGPEEQRAAKEIEARKALVTYMKGHEAWMNYPAEKRALVADQASGLILIPAELEREILRALPAQAVIRGLVGASGIGSDKLSLRSLTEVGVGWGKLELGADLVETTLVPGQQYLYVRNLQGATWIGVDMLEDTDVDIPGHIRESFVRAFAMAEDNGFINGNYAGGDEPEGVLSRVGEESYEIPALPVASTGVVDFGDIIRLAYQVEDGFRVNGAFLVNPGTELALMLTVDGSGRYVWQPSVQAGVPNRVWNYPIHTSQYMPGIQESPSPGDPYAIFGDWRSGYAIRDKKGITLQRLVELQATAGLVGFLVTKRVLGGVVRPNAFAVLVEPE